MPTSTKKDAKRPRGRPRAYDPEKALGDARDLFWEAGFGATSFHELAAATGMNRPSLHGAFGDKQALYLKTLALLREQMQAQISQVLTAPLPLERALKRFYTGALGLYLGGERGPLGCYLVCTATVESARHPDIRAFLGATLGVIDQALQDRFRRAVAEGELAADADTQALAQVAAASLHSLAIRARAGQSRASLLRMAEGAAALLSRR